MLLYCVRHGQSVDNAEGRIQGQSGSGLSELGRRQSRAVAEALGGCSLELSQGHARLLEANEISHLEGIGLGTKGEL
jgi:bisphosphoglycerate-dependent phosphoglycerate mutase